MVQAPVVAGSPSDPSPVNSRLRGVGEGAGVGDAGAEAPVVGLFALVGLVEGSSPPNAAVTAQNSRSTTRRAATPSVIRLRRYIRWRASRIRASCCGVRPLVAVLAEEAVPA